MSGVRTVRQAAPLPALFAKAVVTSRFGGSALPPGGGALRLADVAIDNTRLDKFQRVCGFGISDVVPSTFLHVLAFPLATEIMAARQFPLPLVGLVHVANRIEQVQPVRRGAQVTLDVHAADLRPHRAGRQVDLVTSATVDGVEVFRERSTYLHRRQSGGGKPPVAVTPDPGGQSPAASPARSAGAEVQWRVPGDIGRRYAAVSGDVNPIHLHPWSARVLGFPRAIAHGMWLASRTISALEYRLPDAYVHDVAFKKPVLLPATVRFAARPVDAGWTLAVTSAGNDSPHLIGTLSRC